MEIRQRRGRTDSSENETVENTTQETDNENSNEDNDENKIYKIGESAIITSDLYDFDYEVTATDLRQKR